MPEQYHAEKRTIGGLLSMSEPPIEVSTVQRDFSWDTLHVRAFWEDLLSFSNTHPGSSLEGQEYFLGSIVLAKRGEGDVYVLVDGQQRLATATILLSVIRDFLGKYNLDAARQTQNEYIAKTDYLKGTSPHFDRMYKFQPYEHDRHFFRQLVQDDNIPDAAPKPTQRSHQLIAKARSFFKEQLGRQWETLGGGEKGFLWALRLQKVLTNHVSVVIAIALDEDIAFSVFETLNDRGIGVAPEDLIRNFVTLQAPETARPEVRSNMEKVWALEPELRLEDFFRHYWLSHKGDLKSRSLYRELKSSFSSEKLSPVDYSRDLAHSAEVYQRIVSCSDPDTDTSRHLESVKTLRAQALMPVLLSLFDLAEAGSVTAHQARTLVKTLVSLYVRHNVIGNLESSKLEEELFGLARDLREKKDSAGYALARLAKFAPADSDFKEAFSKAEVRRREVARYLLREIEVHRRRTGELDVAPSNKVNLEHIYPLSPGAEIQDSSLGEAVHRIGNLTILSTALNDKAKNSAFSKKQGFYAASDLLVAKELGDKAKFVAWTPETIAQRQAELANDAVAVWAMPTKP
ncbi:MAG: DUF262 domain-containing protein [Chloroflexi bacterium]|nr:DUF262 domain-containing protein [Chloroflexota bacterium]